MTATAPLNHEQAELIDRSWRAANYLSVLQIHLPTTHFSASRSSRRRQAAAAGSVGNDAGNQLRLLVGRFGPDTEVWEGGTVDAAVDTRRLHFFDPETRLGIYATDKEGAIA
jgi:hypothetical protein